MHDLTRGVNARVGAAGAGHLNGMIGDQFEGFFEALLHAETGLLALPTVVRGTVVLNAERDAHVII